MKSIIKKTILYILFVATLVLFTTKTFGQDFINEKQFNKEIKKYICIIEFTQNGTMKINVYG